MRQEWGRLVALLLSQFRRLDLVEDALGDAVEAASRTWPEDGTPDNPAGWLYRLAIRKALLYRRACGRRAKLVDRYAGRVRIVEVVTPDPLEVGQVLAQSVTSTVGWIWMS